jgi:8-oxo-dGTP pyrophosphatase MutT (NUDIX family)
MSDRVIKKVSAGGVLYHEGKYLVIKWLSQKTVELPKGTIETGETPEVTCVREVLEETGYNVRITHPLNVATFTFKWKDGNTYEKTVHYFLMKRADEALSMPMREEGEDFKNMWVEYDEAIKLLSHDDMREAVERAHMINSNQS